MMFVKVEEVVTIAFLAMGKSEELASATTERMFARLDANKNGFIDYTEFLTANLDEVEVTNTERLRSCFDAIDKVGWII